MRGWGTKYGFMTENDKKNGVKNEKNRRGDTVKLAWIDR